MSRRICNEIEKNVSQSKVSNLIFSIASYTYFAEQCGERVVCLSVGGEGETDLVFGFWYCLNEVLASV